MTREDAAIIVGNIPINEGDDCYTIAEYQEAKTMAIRELTQVEVLDKIRAEIEETYMNITYLENKDRKATWGLRKALEIIDKYMSEESVAEDGNK